jgi:hypothetical protein
MFLCVTTTSTFERETFFQTHAFNRKKYVPELALLLCARNIASTKVSELCVDSTSVCGYILEISCELLLNVRMFCFRKVFNFTCMNGVSM